MGVPTEPYRQIGVIFVLQMWDTTGLTMITIQKPVIQLKKDLSSNVQVKDKKIEALYHEFHLVYS